MSTRCSAKRVVPEMEDVTEAGPSPQAARRSNSSILPNFPHKRKADTITINQAAAIPADRLVEEPTVIRIPIQISVVWRRSPAEAESWHQLREDQTVTPAKILEKIIKEFDLQKFGQSLDSVEIHKPFIADLDEDNLEAAIKTSIKSSTRKITINFSTTSSDLIVDHA